MVATRYAETVMHDRFAKCSWAVEIPRIIKTVTVLRIMMPLLMISPSHECRKRVHAHALRMKRCA